MGFPPGKNTGVGCHFLLQGILPTKISNRILLHWQMNSLSLSHLGCLSGGSKWVGLVPSPDTSLSPGPGGQGKEGWPVWVTGVSYYGAETLQLTTSPGPWRMKEIPQRKKRLWIGNQKIIAIKEGLSWIESSRPLAIQSQKLVIKSLGYGLKLDSIGPQLAVEKWALFQKDDKI